MREKLNLLTNANSITITMKRKKTLLGDLASKLISLSVQNYNEMQCKIF